MCVTKSLESESCQSNTSGTCAARENSAEINDLHPRIIRIDRQYSRCRAFYISLAELWGFALTLETSRFVSASFAHRIKFQPLTEVC